MNRKLRMGMVGGGRNAFIGAVHRTAAAIDGKIELVCGAFSGDPEKSKLSGKDLFLPDDRVYESFEEMIDREAVLPESVKMDAVSIVTPNHLHFKPAKKALENGFHVICDKPLAYSTQEAEELEAIVKQSGLVFALTHTYTGYPMVKQARKMLQEGVLGKIRKVVVEYPQGWLSTPLEKTGQKQATWRSDPAKSGKGGAVGDIGTHAENLVEYFTGLKIVELSADVSTVVEGRVLDDDVNVLIRLDNGAKGVLHCSQICAGEENELNIRIYGEKGGMEWHQEDPNNLILKWLDQPRQIYRPGNPYISEIAQANTRVPPGHPEGYLEAFANIYKNFAYTVSAKIEGTSPNPVHTDFPTVSDGVRGMKFIDAIIDSGNNNAAWTKLD